MLETAIAYKAAVVFGWFGIFFVLERLFRSASPPKSKARLFRNVGLWLIIILVSPLIVAPLTALGANQLIWSRPQSLSTGAWAAAIMVVDLILLDLWTYWLHRAYHRVPAMWRLHEVHHRDEFLDTTDAFRFHIGEVILSAVLRVALIAVLALPLTTVLIFETLVVAAAIFHHSNVRLPDLLEKALSRLVVTPSIHWVHHHALKRDTDSNYATILSVWDLVFGSKSDTKRTQTMRIGVESVDDQSLLRLILMPFRKNG